MNDTSNLQTPDWLKPGAIVHVQFWVGEIVEVAQSHKRTMVCVKSPKSIWRGHPPEWLEFMPEHIRLATLEEFRADAIKHRRLIRQMLLDLEAWEETTLEVFNEQRE